MLILGIETSTPVSSVALWNAAGSVAGSTMAQGRGHVEFLMPAVVDLLDKSGHAIGDVTGVAVGLGPGLFTGMRAGIATAKALAHSLPAPIVGIPSLDLLAFPVRHFAGLICACIDAKRGEIFAAFYRRVPGGAQRQGEARAWAPEALAAELEARDEEVLVVGTGPEQYPEAFGRVRHERASGAVSHPTADALCELAMPRFEREEYVPVVQVEPLYVRKTDAEIKWDARGLTIERPLRVKPSKRVVEAAGGDAG